MATLNDFIDSELGVSQWVCIDQALIDEFADCTGDDQWIHVDTERARRESPHGTTIAHGYLCLSLLARFKHDIGVIPDDATHAINYGLDRVRFLAPVKAGARIRGHVRLQDVESKGDAKQLLRMETTVEIEGEDKPALIAESLVLVLGG